MRAFIPGLRASQWLRPRHFLLEHFETVNNHALLIDGMFQGLGGFAMLLDWDVSTLEAKGTC